MDFIRLNYRSKSFISYARFRFRFNSQRKYVMRQSRWKTKKKKNHFINSNSHDSILRFYFLFLKGEKKTENFTDSLALSTRHNDHKMVHQLSKINICKRWLILFVLDKFQSTHVCTHAYLISYVPFTWLPSKLKNDNNNKKAENKLQFIMQNLKRLHYTHTQIHSQLNAQSYIVECMRMQVMIHECIYCIANTNWMELEER